MISRKLIRDFVTTLRIVVGVILVGMGCSACESLPQKVKVDFAEPRTSQPIGTPVKLAATQPTGSLFHAASYRPAFEDVRARAVGDTVTIQIVENITASQKSASTVNRSSTIDASVSAFPLFPAGELAKLSVGTSSANDFSGKGGTESAR